MRFIFALALLSQFVVPPQVKAANVNDSIREVMSAQQSAWNRGDLTAFMAGYWRGENLRFASGNSYRHGWQATLDNYIKGYPNQAAMGKLAFDIIEIEQIGQDAALVFGHWRLTREKDAPQGLFTLLFRKFGSRWLITRDHTSSAK